MPRVISRVIMIIGIDNYFQSGQYSNGNI